MKMFIVSATIYGEDVTLYHRPASQSMVNEWLENNQARLASKGFHSLEVDDYYDEWNL